MISRRAIVFIAIGLFLGSSCVLAEEKQIFGPNLGNILNEMLDVGKIIDGLAETALDQIGDLTQLLPKIIDMLRLVLDVLKRFTSLPQDLTKFLAAPLAYFLNSFLKNVIPILEALIVELGDLLESLITPRGEELDDATNMISSRLDTIVGILVAVGSSLADAVKSQDEIIQNAVAPVLEAVANNIGTVSGLLCDILNANISESLENISKHHQETLATLLGSLKLSTCKLSACQSLNKVVDSLTGTINKCNL